MKYLTSFFVLLFLSTKLLAAEPKLHELISSSQIDARLEEVCAKIHTDNEGRPLCVIAILKGSYMLLADLSKHLTVPHTVDFVKASSYGQRGTKRGGLTLHEIGTLDIENKDVLLIDDIFDSGVTLSTVVEKLQEKNPRSIKTLVLLSKKVPKATPYVPNYVLFEIDDHFVIGYGLDFKEYFRNLNGVYIVENDDFTFFAE
ncbi:MAG: Hypoxanthine phosphoribosyltransferase [Chlamydiae bacterium]|nr:Hypoxanthine phosphoribosyltransferase [Chlamydiota bacterium]